MMEAYFVYILVTDRNGTLYTGVTSDLCRRVDEHKTDAVDSFTKKYGVHKLVYFEQTPDVDAAIRREKQLKKWHRQWKLELIEKANPQWEDLALVLDSLDAGSSAGMIIKNRPDGAVFVCSAEFT